MSQTYEISKFESKMPLRCYIHHIGNMPNHSHEMFEIIFVLSGNCNLTVDGHLFQLNAEDIFIIEDFLPHELHAADCVYATIQLDRTHLENTFPNPIHPTFECNSQIPGKEAAFNHMRRKIAQIIKNNADKPLGWELKNWIYIYELMDILFINFRVERSAALERKNHRYAERVHEISKIIKEHYTEDLPLSALADMLHLSVPYLSKFFQEHFGVNYLTYLTQLRIKNAEYDLLHTEKTIEAIAADCGFPNANAFTSAFKKEYGTRPSTYRKNKKTESDPTVQIEYHDYMQSLRKYLTSDPGDAITTPIHSKDGLIDVATRTHTLSHYWRKIVSVGQASDLLLADVQEILRYAQEKISYEYIFFNGIFSDNLFLYRLKTGDTAAYNFTYADRIFDFLQSIGLKPLLSFSYMPRDLAKNPDHYLFSHLVSEPRNLSLWRDLIEQFMSHIIDRYGLSTVLSWRFCVWHEPNTPARLYGFSKNSDFYAFYEQTRNTVKKFSEKIAFGFPCMYYLTEETDTNFVSEMLAWCKEHDCVPDFLNYSFYDAILDYSRSKTKDTFGFVDSMTLNPETDGLKNAIASMRKREAADDVGNLPIYISEWNNTPSQQDYLNDTCFKSCYITKNILENYDKIDGLSYWTLTDLLSERAIPDETFFGGLGLFTANRIPKASFHAMCLLRQLGDEFLAQGEGWFCTKTDKDIRIIAYHYKHFTELYSVGERFDMTKTDRYTMFNSMEDLNLKLTLRGMEDRAYQIKEYILNQSSGSSFDLWVESGCMEPQCEEDIQYLRNSAPRRHNYQLNTNNYELTLELTLKILEVRLIVIR